MRESEPHESSNLLGEAPEFTATDFFDDPYWNMLQVIAWVTTRAPALVHKASDNFKGQQRHSEMLNTPSGPRMCEIPSEPFNWVSVTMHATLWEIAIGGTARTRLEVEREIVRSLESGRLTATGVEIGQSKPAEILRADWAYLELDDDDRLGICARNRDKPKKYELRFSGLKVPRDEVLAEWPQAVPESPAAEGRDNVIVFPAGTQYWPVADLPELMAQARSADGRAKLDVIAEYRRRINWERRRPDDPMCTICPTTRAPVDDSRADAEASIFEIEKFVNKFDISVRLAPPMWDAETIEAMTKATHWTERELEAACFRFPLTMYHDLCVPDAQREEMRGAIEQACKSGELVAERSGRGNAMYGGRWRVERLSAVRWAIGNCPNFPDQLASANLPDIFAEQDAARENAGRYTLRQASDEIARNTGESADEFVEKFKRAVCARELAVHRPGERARYYPETVREFYEESYWDDLNSWLGANEPRIEWRFPEPSKTTEAASVPRDRLNLGSLFLETDDLGELRTGGELAESESPALDTFADADEKLAAMFDAVGVSALETMFPAKGKWQGWANKAKENGLNTARSARASFNPYLAALWWFHSRRPENWDWRRITRVLAKNLPSRSKDEGYRLTGEIE